MLISKIYNNLSKSDKKDLIEGIVCGLIFGLVWGLIFGLIFGLIWGLVWGLVLGLVWGLVWGLVFGLVWGLVSGLVFGLGLGLVSGLGSGLIVILINFSEAFPFIQGITPIILTILGIIILAEIMFWLTKEKKPKKNIFWHTCKRKLENIFEVLLTLSAISQIYILIREVDFLKLLPTIIKWIGYIGFGMITLACITGLFYLWIKLNSLKYK